MAEPIQLPCLTRAQLLAIFFVFVVSVSVFKLIFASIGTTLVYFLLHACHYELSVLRMDIKATDLLAALKNSNNSIEAKAAQLTKLKSEIKQKNVPESAVATIFDAFRYAISSQHSSLSGAGFSALGHLLKRLYLQEQHQIIAGQGRSTYPLLLERLGDHKERIRAQAAQAFSDFWSASSVEVEHHVLEVALVGKNARAKETCMVWLVNVCSSRSLASVSPLVNLLAHR
jgi:CLIP-associating protein 1/2